MGRASRLTEARRTETYWHDGHRVSAPATDQVGVAESDQWYVNVLTPYAEQVAIGAVPLQDQQDDHFTAAGGSSFVIPACARNPAAACAWALELTTPEAWQAGAHARMETTASEPERLGINARLFTGSPGSDTQIREAQPMATPAFK